MDAELDFTKYPTQLREIASLGRIGITIDLANGNTQVVVENQDVQQLMTPQECYDILSPSIVKMGHAIMKRARTQIII